jgi:hypothetical protein
LFIGSARHGYGADNTAALDDRYGATTGHNPTVARHHQALKPALSGDARQIFRRLLKARRRICFIESDFHGDRTGLVHAPKRDHATALIDDDGSYGNIELCCLAMCSAHHLNRLFSWNSHAAWDPPDYRFTTVQSLFRYFSRNPAWAVKRIARGSMKRLENIDCPGGQKRDDQKRQQ